VLYFMPPYIMTKEEMTTMIETAYDAVKAL
jgi:adenosylmethionine-8-amino-7-oxononanoate aminotransferase